MTVTTAGRFTAATGASASHQAYQILHFAFTVAPILAGLDKFFHLMVNWDQYLAPAIAGILPISAHAFMLIVGVVEMVAGVLVAIVPRIGAPIVGVWLLGIVANLLILGGYYDVALRDFGLALGAFALFLLSVEQASLPSRQ